MKKYFCFLLCAIGLIVSAPSAMAQFTFIPRGAPDWRYLDNGSDQGIAWSNPFFDDSTWASGTAELGYGDFDEATVVSFGPDSGNKYVTTYFRKQFWVTNAAEWSNVVLRLVRDDGAVVYINGTEVARHNMPAGPVTYQTLANVIVNPPEESTFFEETLSPSVLVDQLNTIAVEIHQVNPTSSDISFNLELVGTKGSSGTAPTIVTHPQSQTVAEGSDVTFSVSATGSEPLRYRWRRNSITIPGATNSTLTLFSVTTSNAGNYSVIVSNSFGGVLSSNAVLTVTSTNLAPVVTLHRPTNGSTFSAGSNIPMLAEASDPDGTVNFVDFFANSTLLGRVMAANTNLYSFVWSNAPPGTFQIRAEAIDNAGGRGFSGSVQITTGAPSTNTGGFAFIPRGSVWRYRDDGSDQGTAWQAVAFDDSSWTSGPAQLGYGDGDETTVVSFGPDPFNKFITTYFRRHFIVTNAAQWASVAVRLLRDDGAVVYLNGTEIARQNMPAGPIDYQTLAVVAVNPPEESAFFEQPVPRTLLVSGQNTIAVEVHQVNPSSSDVSFDLELVGTAATRPTIVEHPQSQTVASGSDVTFSVVATGTEPLSYRWRRNAVTILGATNSTLTLFNVTSANAGNYSVVVSNPAGSVLSSNAVLTVITDGTNAPPVVTWLRPTNGSRFVAGSTILLQARATDSDGVVNFVEFFANGTRLGQVTSNTNLYNFVWSNAPAGTFQLHAEAVDSAGMRGISGSVQIVVASSNSPPVVTLTSPTNGATFRARQPIILRATASDPDGTVSFVDFFANTTRVARAFSSTGTFTSIWSNAPAGTHQIRAVATDNQGAQASSATASITVFSNRPPTAIAQSVTVQEDSSVAITLSGTDPDGDFLTFRVVTLPVHGTLSGSAPNLTYTPDPNYFGPDSFTFTVRDPEFESAPATVEITVTPVNDAPVAHIQIENAVTFLDRPTLITLDEASGTVILDGSQSTDVDNDPLVYVWSVGDPPVPFATGVRVTNEFPTDTYVFQLQVSDGELSDTAVAPVDLLTPCQAIGRIILRIEESSHPNTIKRPLISCLTMACRTFEQDDVEGGIDALGNFQDKVEARLGEIDPAFAEVLINAAQTLIDAIPPE
jgi:hypothetical protein